MKYIGVTFFSSIVTWSDLLTAWLNDIDGAKGSDQILKECNSNLQCADFTVYMLMFIYWTPIKSQGRKVGSSNLSMDFYFTDKIKQGNPNLPLYQFIS